MRIGIDCRTILSAETGELAGTAHYTYELVRHLLALDQNNMYVLFFNARTKTVGHDGRSVQEIFTGRNIEIVFLPVSRMPLLTTHLLLSRALTRAKLDLFHSPAHPLPLFYRGKTIYTVHDLAIYDHPEWFPSGFRRWFSIRVTVPRSIRRAVLLIAPSESTKRDIIRIFNVPEEKIKVVYEGAPDSCSLKHVTCNIEKPFFLFIGTIEPRKNLVRLIDAFIRFRQTYHLSPITYNLILAGANGWKNDDVFLTIEKANVRLGRGSVQYLSYVSHEEKIALLQNATAFIWPSLYEGFGLPILEAMVFGVPIITSTTSSIPEITRDAAILVNPESVADIARAMERITHDAVFCEQLKTRGLARAEEFTWEKAARETLAVYNTASSFF